MVETTYKQKNTLHVVVGTTHFILHSGGDYAVHLTRSGMDHTGHLTRSVGTTYDTSQTFQMTKFVIKYSYGFLIFWMISHKFCSKKHVFVFFQNVHDEITYSAHTKVGRLNKMSASSPKA